MAYIQTRTRTSDGGTSYRVRWRLGGRRDGEMQSETFDSRAQAEAFAEDVESAGEFWPPGWVKGYGYAERTPSDTRTFADVAASYFADQDRRVALGRIKAYTVHRDRRTVALHHEPVLGPLLFDEISGDDVADWVDSELEAGRSPKSIKNWHGLLYSVMKHGQNKLGIRSDNPCDLTELPDLGNAREARQVRFFQHAEWALMRACLKQDVLLLVDVMLATGLRWGEVSALRAGDVSPREDGSAVLHVVRAWSKRAPDDAAPIHRAEGENRMWVLGPPKGKRSRYAVLTGQVAAELLEHCGSLPPGQYVFTTRAGNPWRYPDFHSDRWVPARREAERRGLAKHVTPHMMRHTTVVWSLAQGVKIEVVSEMIGHRSIQITYDVYGGLIDLHDPVMAEAMARAALTARSTTVSAPTRQEVEARRVRPGARGARRARGGALSADGGAGRPAHR